MDDVDYSKLLENIFKSSISQIVDIFEVQWNNGRVSSVKFKSHRNFDVIKINFGDPKISEDSELYIFDNDFAKMTNWHLKALNDIINSYSVKADIYYDAYYISSQNSAQTQSIGYLIEIYFSNTNFVLPEPETEGGYESWMM